LTNSSSRLFLDILRLRSRKGGNSTL